MKKYLSGESVMLKIQLAQRFNQALLLTMLAVFGVVTNADVDQSRLDAVKADLQSRIDENKLSGAVVMVAQDGEVLMHEALGYQNLEDQVPMSTETIFRIFSMTKPVTGTALMLLYDEGKFELDDPVEKHLPELAGMEAVSYTHLTLPTILLV